MPDEFDLRNLSQYKKFEDFNSREALKYIHSVYLKAVNHPIRREILRIINQEGQISKYNLLKKLREKGLDIDKEILKYNLNYLLKAFCIEYINHGNDKKSQYKITQNGKVVEYLK